MNPMTKQVGGNHYVKLAIRPTEFAMANHLDPIAHAILKYLTRHQDKLGREDLEKAFHNVEMREVLGTEKHLVHDWVVSMDEYCRANELAGPETAILLNLALWLESHSPMYPHLIKQGIKLLILSRYPTAF